MTSFALQLLRLYGFSAVAPFFFLATETCVCRVLWSAYVHSRHLWFFPLVKRDHFTEYIFTYMWNASAKHCSKIWKHKNVSFNTLIVFLSVSAVTLVWSRDFFWRKHQSKSEMCSTYLKKKRRENKKEIVKRSKSKYSIRFTVVVNIATAAATVRIIFSGYFFLLELLFHIYFSHCISFSPIDILSHSQLDSLHLFFESSEQKKRVFHWFNKFPSVGCLCYGLGSSGLAQRYVWIGSRVDAKICCVSRWWCSQRMQHDVMALRFAFFKTFKFLWDCSKSQSNVTFGMQQTNACSQKGRCFSRTFYSKRQQTHTHMHTHTK